MKKRLLILCLLGATVLMGCETLPADTVRVATFNVSMEATNYVERDERPSGNELHLLLQGGQHPQIRNIAEIIQRVRPDILLLNEFDYLSTSAEDIEAFRKNFLAVAQNGAEPIHFPYAFAAPVNTGVGSGIDLNRDGEVSDAAGDAFGFGLYPGQYGMLILSRYPIALSDIRTFQHFLWKDMPDNLMTDIRSEDGEHWYSEQAQQILRLSSKSHWDVPIEVNGQRLHLLASHPTPPVFDGPENRNGLRNHDEIRFWRDYLSKATYFYDDQHRRGAFEGERFVIVGDLNASQHEGDSFGDMIGQLINHPRVNGGVRPISEGGGRHSPDNRYGPEHTAAWRMRVDYVLPGKAGMSVKDSGVFWPQNDAPLARLVESRASSSDHRLVWVDLDILE